MSCANNPIRSYKHETDKPIVALQNGQIQEAIAKFNTKESDIMYHLELGSLYRMNKNYDQSIVNLNYANNYINKWIVSINNSTIGNVKNSVVAGLINDKVIDYQIKDYEKVMIATYLALDQISLNHFDNARIEIKRMYQIEDRIRQFHEQQYHKEELTAKSDANNSKTPTLAMVEAKGAGDYNFAYINQPQVLQLQNSYQNAFSHYLAGFLFEALGEYDLARPGYVRAYELAPSNNLALQSISLLNQHQNIKTNMTNLLVVEEVGHAPQYKSQTISIPWVISKNNHSCPIVLKFALPMLYPDNENNTATGFILDNRNYSPALFTNINLMAARYLNDDLPNVIALNTVHALRDALLQSGACDGSQNSDQNIIGSLVMIGLAQFLNEADERTWVMLPSAIYASRLMLPYGFHNLQVSINGKLYTININLNKPFQVITYRIMGDNVYFSPSIAMH